MVRTRLFPFGTTPHAPKRVAEAEQLVENAQQVPIVPFPIVQVAAHEFGHVVEERLVPVGRVAGHQFEQRHKVVVRMVLEEGCELRGKGRRGRVCGNIGGRGLHILKGLRVLVDGNNAKLC